MYFEEELKSKGVLYVSGYENFDSVVTLKCETCGHVWTQTFHNLINGIRGNKKNKRNKNRNKETYTACPCCREAKMNLRIQDQRLEKQRKKQIKEEKMFLISFGKWLKSNTVKLYRRKCKNCMSAFVTTNRLKKYCSTRCQKRFKESTNRVRRNTLLSSRKKDKGITLDRLYKRDKGTCYLCGCKCDRNDFKKIDGSFIAGANYPTIEHVLPVSKGGTETWDNVKLAHMHCNVVKGTNYCQQISLF